MHYHGFNQIRQFFLIDETIVGHVVSANVRCQRRSGQRVNVHVKRRGETLVNIALTGSSNGEQKLVEVDPTIVVAIESGEGMPK